MEYWLFFKLSHVGLLTYWEEGEYGTLDPPPLEVFTGIAQKIESIFFSMDIARTQQGQWIIIELGDGQVAGLPDKADSNSFYSRLRSATATALY